MTSIPTTILALVALIALIGLFWNRWGKADQPMKGIGWQAIRFTVLAMALPITAILALNGVLDGELAATIISGSMGYAFGKGDAA